MKLSKLTHLVFFHFALVLITLSKIDCMPYFHTDNDIYVGTSYIFSDSLCSGVLGPNLLSIGDFGTDTAQIVLEDPMITLGYGYQNAPPPDDGFYTLTNDISNWGSFADLFWINIGDNSADTTGYMMVINAHYEPGNFYKEVIDVCENTTYVFSADMINLTKTEIENFILPSVDFLINGVVVSSMTDIPQDEAWHTSQFSYTTGPGESSLVYVIRNSAPGGFGNDLAIDNIFMKTCNGQVEITQHENLCEDGYLQATPYSLPENFSPHYQWEYSLDGGAAWYSISNNSGAILSLNNQPSDALYRCLIGASPNSFGLSSCYGTSNLIEILFPAILKETYPIICDDEVYTINGNSYTTTGSYEDVFTSFFGCDSIVVTNLEVLASSSYDEVVFICEDESYDLNGTLISTTNLYKDTLVNAVGCDSIITIDLRVLENSTYTFEEFICDASSYFFNDELLATSGIYKDTLTAFNGCDSLVTLHLNVNLSYESFHQETICHGEYYTFDGFDETVSGEYDVVLSTVNGCDSILHLSLEVLEEKESEINQVVCAGQDYVYNGVSYNTDGIYFETLTSNSGCDSTIILDLSFDLAIEMSLAVDICEGETYFFKNTELSEQGVYKDTLQNTQGCDSIVTLNLFKYNATDLFLQQDICENETYQFGNEILTSSGNYVHTLTNQYGCDSLIYLDLMVHAKYETPMPVNICQGEVYTFNEQDYSSTGDYPILLNSVNNCDSTIVLQLNVSDEIESYLQQAICAGNSFEMGGTDYSTSGIYEATMFSYSGCDSTVYLDLQVYQNTTTALVETICNGESFQMGNSIYTENGTYTTTLTTQTGCDSIVTLDLTVYQSESFETLTFCHGETYNGISVDTTIAIIAPSYWGCDSITQLQLSFFEMDALQITGDSEFCEGAHSVLSANHYETYLWSNGATTSEIEISQSGIYEVTVWDENGCSSSESIEVEMRTIDAEIMFQNPTCNNSIAGIIQVQDVFGSGGNYQYQLNDQEFSTNKTFFNLSAGAYNVTIRDDYGCDYVEEFYLEDPADFEINMEENKIVEYGDSTEIVVDVGGSEMRIDTLFWFPEEGLSCVDCMNPIASPVISTVYTLTIITEEGCTFRDQIHVNVFKSRDVYTPNIFSPNGNGQNDVFKIYAGKMVEKIIQIEIYDRWGEIVYSETPNNVEMKGWDGNFRNQELKQGVYIYCARMLYKDGEELVISGDITLVR